LHHRNHNHSLSQAERLPVKQHSSDSGPGQLLQDAGVNPYENDLGWYLPIYRYWTMLYGEPVMPHERFHPWWLQLLQQQAKVVMAQLHFGLQQRCFHRYLLTC